MVKRKGSSRIERTTPLGEYLTLKRVGEGLTQKEIAKKIKRSTSYICRIETGQRERKSLPQKKSLQKKSLRGFILYQLAKAYKASIAEILEKANWPQLLLLDTTKEERQELLRHLERIRKTKRRQERQAEE